MPDTDKLSTLYVASFVCICGPSEITMYENHMFTDESAMQLCDTNDIFKPFALNSNYTVGNFIVDDSFLR